MLYSILWILVALYSRTPPLVVVVPLASRPTLFQLARSSYLLVCRLVAVIVIVKHEVDGQRTTLLVEPSDGYDQRVRRLPLYCPKSGRVLFYCIVYHPSVVLCVLIVLVICWKKKVSALLTTTHVLHLYSKVLCLMLAMFCISSSLVSVAISHVCCFWNTPRRRSKLYPVATQKCADKNCYCVPSFGAAG